MPRERSLEANATEDKTPRRAASAGRAPPTRPSQARPKSPFTLHRVLDAFPLLWTYRAKLFAAVLVATLTPAFLAVFIATIGAHRMSVATLVLLLIVLGCAGAALGIWLLHRLVAPLDAAISALDAFAERREIERIEIGGTDTAAQILRGVQALIGRLKSQDDERRKRDEHDVAGLYSRTAGPPKAQALIDSECRRGRVVRIVAVRVDGFGAFNDTHGYGQGDALLKAVAVRIARVAADQGVAMRWSGDEFMLVRAIPPGEPPDIEEAIGRAIVARGVDEAITLSIGVVQTEQSVPFETLAARAAEALAEARKRRAERERG
jgi:diguanylate cyclase (GGDEF)-like protein